MTSRSTAPDRVPETSSSTTAWGVVLLLMAIAFIAHFNRVSITIAANTHLMREYGISETQMGVVYSAFLIAYTLMMIPGGLFIDRFSSRVALMVVCFGSAGFVALTGGVGFALRDGASAFAALLVVRALMGVVSSPLHPGCASAVGRWVDPGIRSWTNGLVTGAALVGIAATAPGFGSLIDRFGWPASFLIAAALTAIVALAWSMYTAGRVETQPVHEVEPEAEPPSWSALLRDRSLVLLTFSYAAVSYFQYLFFYWMNYYFLTVLKLPEETSRAYSIAPPLAMAVGMPLGGWLSDRLERTLGTSRGRRIVPMAGMAAGAALLGLGVAAREPIWIVSWFALALGAVGMAEGPFWVTATELGGRRAGSAAALINTGGNGFGALAPVVTPWVGTHYGWGSAVAVGGLVGLAGLVLWIWIEPGPRVSNDLDQRLSTP